MRGFCQKRKHLIFFFEESQGDRGRELWEAARDGHKAAVERLIRDGENIEYRGGYDKSTPLSTAAVYGHLHVVQFLVDPEIHVVQIH